MIKNKFGELIFSENDLFDCVMQGQDIGAFSNAIVDANIDLTTAKELLQNIPEFVVDNPESYSQLSTEQFDLNNQRIWRMPMEYKDLDIAQYVLDLCTTDEELQRVGQELLLYQERNLFDLLRYLKYLVDVMQANRMIWGVGRGSSLSSYVLYLLKVHRIDSMYYDLDPSEFLR